MYLKLKYKYKKFFWLLLGFCLACLFTTKHVKAFTLGNGIEVTNQTINDIWENNVKNKSYNLIYPNLAQNSSKYTKTFAESTDPFQYVIIKVLSNYEYEVHWFRYTSEMFNMAYNNTYLGTIDNINRNVDYIGYPYVYVNTNNNTINVNTYNQQYLIYFRQDDTDYYWSNSNGVNSGFKFYINYDMFRNSNNELIKSPNFSLSDSLPSYLTGYKRVSLTTDDKYYMLSGLSSGSVFIPTQDFHEFGGRLSYFDNDIASQPYTSYIQDYYLMPDGEYIRQDFNLSSYSGADFALFSKYIYLEGEDDISYDIWVPNDIYASSVTVTPNLNGGNTFSFDYLDSNGDLQSDSIIGQDLSLNQESPLLSNLFSDFTANDFGLSSIVTAPLSLIQSLNNASCTDLEIPLGPLFGSGVHDNKLILPCMTPIYQSYFGNFLIYYQTITTGFIAYWVGIAFFNMIKQLKDPENDKIEVIDL